MTLFEILSTDGSTFTLRQLPSGPEVVVTPTDLGQSTFFNTHYVVLDFPTGGSNLSVHVSNLGAHWDGSSPVIAVTPFGASWS